MVTQCAEVCVTESKNDTVVAYHVNTKHGLDGEEENWENFGSLLCLNEPDYSTDSDEEDLHDYSNDKYDSSGWYGKDWRIYIYTERCIYQEDPDESDEFTVYEGALADVEAYVDALLDAMVRGRRQSRGRCKKA